MGSEDRDNVSDKNGLILRATAVTESNINCLMCSFSIGFDSVPSLRDSD